MISISSNKTIAWKWLCNWIFFWSTLWSLGRWNRNNFLTLQFRNPRLQHFVEIEFIFRPYKIKTSCHMKFDELKILMGGWTLHIWPWSFFLEYFLTICTCKIHLCLLIIQSFFYCFTNQTKLTWFMNIAFVVIIKPLSWL